MIEYSKQHYSAEQITDPMINMTCGFLIAGTVEILQQWLDGMLLISKQQLITDLASLWQGIGDYTAMHIAKRNV